MPVCHSHHFGYIHVQKTAGISLTTALRASGLALDFDGRGILDLLREHPHGRELLQRFRIEYPFASVSVFAQPHLPAVLLRELVGFDIWNAYFKFAFVRNPWDRAVSVYAYMKAQMERPGAKERQPDNYAMMERSPDFASYLNWSHLSGNDMTSLLADDAGALLVDFVGRYERLDEDIAKVCERVGISLDLPRLNASERGNYRDYYTPTTQAIVAKSCARDIDLFGYVF